MDLRRSLELLSELTGASVQPAALALGQAAVEGVAQQLMAEVEQPAQPGWVEHVLVDELAQRSVEGVGGHVHDAGENLGHEAPPDHRAGAGHGLRFRGEPADALENRVLQSVRHGRVADRAAVRPFVLGDRPEQLFDVERNAVSPRVDRVDDVARRRQTGAEDERRHERRLLEGQGRESRLLGDALCQEPRPPLPQEGARRELVGAIGADDQQRSIAGRPSELGEDLEAQVVRPLQVVEREHRRAVKRADDQIDGLEDEGPAPRLRGGHGRVGKIEELPSEVRPRLQARHRARHVEQRRRRHVAVLGSEEPGRRPEARAARLCLDGGHESRLADAGFASQQEELPSTRRRLRQAAFGEIEQVVPSDQDRREAWPQACHEAESTLPIRVVIGRMTDVPRGVARLALLHRSETDGHIGRKHDGGRLRHRHPFDSKRPATALPARIAGKRLSTFKTTLAETGAQDQATRDGATSQREGRAAHVSRNA